MGGIQCAVIPIHIGLIVQHSGKQSVSGSIYKGQVGQQINERRYPHEKKDTKPQRFQRIGEKDPEK